MHMGTYTDMAEARVSRILYMGNPCNLNVYGKPILLRVPIFIWAPYRCMGQPIVLCVWARKLIWDGTFILFNLSKDRAQGMLVYAVATSY